MNVGETASVVLILYAFEDDVVVIVRHPASEDDAMVVVRVLVVMLVASLPHRIHRHNAKEESTVLGVKCVLVDAVLVTFR